MIPVKDKTIKKFPTRLFAYGTLLTHSIQRSVWGEERSGTSFILNDYELMYDADTGLFYIEKRLGETVTGKIYTIDEKQLKSTDWYEGEGELYHRVHIIQDGNFFEVYEKLKKGEDNVTA